MVPTLVAWMLSGCLALFCLSLAVSAWKQEAWLSGRSRTSLLVGMLEAAAVAGFFRLAVQWSPGTVVLWVVAVAGLAAAVAGVIIRWDELPERSRPAEVAVPAVGPKPGAGPLRTKSRKKLKSKPKKDPGKATVAGHACLLAVVVALSFAAG